MFKFGGLLVFLTAACATGADIYAAGVDETAVINRPLPDVSRCMALRLGGAAITEGSSETFFLKGGGACNG